MRNVLIDLLHPYNSNIVSTSLVPLKDLNDFSPEFSQPLYQGMVAPNAVKGTIVTTVLASDADPAVSFSSCLYPIKPPVPELLLSIK